MATDATNTYAYDPTPDKTFYYYVGDQYRDFHKNNKKKYELLFGGTLFTSEIKPVDIELQTDDKPYHEKPCPVAREHEENFKK